MALSYPTLFQAVISKTGAQSPIMDAIEKKSAILQTLIATPATHKTQHKFTLYDDLPVPTFRNANEGILPTTSSTGLITVDLKTLESIEIMDRIVADAHNNRLPGLVADKIPAIGEAFSQKLASSIIYGSALDAKSFKGIRSYATSFGNIIPGTVSGDGTSTECTSIYICRWEVGKNGLLYNDEALNPLTGIADISVDNTIRTHAITQDGIVKYITGYEAIASAWAGFFCATKYSVAALTQRSTATGKGVTIDEVEKAIDMVKADTTGQSFIYVSRVGRRILKALKAGYYRMNDDNKALEARIDTWDGIPILVDDNISDLESAALDVL